MFNRCDACIVHVFFGLLQLVGFVVAYYDTIPGRYVTYAGGLGFRVFAALSSISLWHNNEKSKVRNLLLTTIFMCGAVMCGFTLMIIQDVEKFLLVSHYTSVVSRLISIVKLYRGPSC
jgi:hypothetical protein